MLKNKFKPQDFHLLVAILLGANSLKKKINCPPVFNANNHEIDNYCLCIFVNNSASSASIFTNSDFFESSEPSGHVYKISYNSDVCIRRYSRSKIVTNF